MNHIRYDPSVKYREKLIYIVYTYTIQKDIVNQVHKNTSTEVLNLHFKD